MTTTIAKRPNGSASASFGNVVDNIFQNSLKHFFDNNFWDQPGNVGLTQAPVNIRELEQYYEIDVMAPGCRKDDFKINIQDNILLISYDEQQHDEKEEDDKAWVRNEYKMRSFTRRFTLDDTVDFNKIDATYTDGVLRLKIFKNEKAKPLSRSIEVK